VSRELAHAGVAHQLLIDYDLLKPENFPRHVLGKVYKYMNKAEAMAVYLEDELGQSEHRVAPLLIRDDLISDSELTELFTGVDLVIAATGHPRTQRRIADLALRTWGIPALFPAITGPFSGEVYLQLDRDFPCFRCWHRFRDENAGADAVTALNIDAALGIAGLTASLALGLLNESADTDLLTPGPQGFQPQLFIQTRRAFAVKPVRRRRNCPSCGGLQMPEAPEPPAMPIPPEGDSVISPLPTWPMPPPITQASARTPPVTVRTRTDSPTRSLLIVLSLLGCLIVLVIALAESGGHTPSAPAESRREKAEAQAAAGAAANGRIASLSFKCIEQRVCHTDFPNYPLPVFISGLDAPLRRWLADHGYSDEWSDSTGKLHESTVGPGQAEGGSGEYVASAGLPEAEEPSGLIYAPQGDPAYGAGPETTALPPGRKWTIVWRLKDPTGHVVKTLRYTVKMVTCTDAADSYCEQVRQERDRNAQNGTSIDEAHSYSSAAYTPPPLFPH
jgi:hypothetical protein